MEDLIEKTLAGRYRVLSRIGRGGMAEVYQVWDSHRMTYLAMKVLHQDLAVDRVFMRRFQREASTLAKLQHPNIVRFYGLERDGRLAFMLLDYIRGENLKPKIFDAAGPYPLEGVRTIMHAVCGALAYAHRQGHVHCDIKPANIMIDENGRVLLSDFGIARMTDAATATMVGAGTPAYMAPEQARGLDPTPQTDIYALGIVLFEMLTGGERPFTGEQAQTTGSTSEKVRWEQITLSAPSPRNWNPEIVPDLEAVVMKCLAKNPAERYADTLELLNAFEIAKGGKKGEGTVAQKRTKPFPHPTASQRNKATSVPATSVSSTRRNIAPWLLAGAMIIITLGVWIFSGGNNAGRPAIANSSPTIYHTQTAQAIDNMPTIVPTLTVDVTSTTILSTAMISEAPLSDLLPCQYQYKEKDSSIGFDTKILIEKNFGIVFENLEHFMEYGKTIKCTKDSNGHSCFYDGENSPYYIQVGWELIFPNINPNLCTEAGGTPSIEEITDEQHDSSNNSPSTSEPMRILFKDDFSNPLSGWDRVDVSEGITDYENGHYRILVNTEDTDIWANPGLHFSDVIIEVDATKVGGPDDNDFGIICRYLDIENFYFFIISSDGYYGIGKYDDSEWTLLNADQMYPDDAINQGNATNRIRAECIGSQLALYANGTKLAEIKDATFPSGDVGLLAGTLTETGTDIHFDNFTVLSSD